MEHLSQELITIIAAAIALAAVMVPGVRSLRREISDLCGEMSALRGEFRSDLGVFREEMRADLNSFRDEMRGEMNAFRDEMRGEFNSFQEEMRGEMNAFREEMRGEFSDVRADLSESRERMARVEGLFEGFTRSEPGLRTGSA